MFVSESDHCSNVAPCGCVAEKPGAAPAPAAAPAAAPTKKLDNLFFIEEPKTAHVTESESHNMNMTHSMDMIQQTGSHFRIFFYKRVFLSFYYYFNYLVLW